MQGKYSGNALPVRDLDAPGRASRPSPLGFPRGKPNQTQRVVNTPDISNRRGAASGPPAEPHLVLLVEDNPTNQRLMRRLLENMHCRVDVAGNGREAVAKVGAARYQVVFMDLHMPVMDGYDATVEIRRVAPHSQLPIVAVTASVLKEDHDRCRQVGMDQVITKPVDPDEIRAALARWCQHARGSSGDPVDAAPAVSP